MQDTLRVGEVQRETRETKIWVKIEIDGQGQEKIDTEIPFLDHMLTLLSVHSRCNLFVTARGDLEVDDHHTVEDIGICLGEAIKKALGDKTGISRYGEATVPMDEALVRVVLDFSGRPHLSYAVEIPGENLGKLSRESVQEFFQAVVNHAGLTLHIDLLRGQNSHHIVEAVFKAFSRALKMAVTLDPNIRGVLSSKGQL